MGVDPLTIGLGISAATSLWGAYQGNKAQKRSESTAAQNFDFQRQAYNDAQGALTQKNQMLQGLIMPMLNGSSYNTGQDGMMQQMRGLPDGRPDSSLIGSLRALSAQDLNDQISQQRGQAGSLGQRFGTAQQGIEARLRERATVGLGAQYGQIGMQEQQMQQNKMLGLLGLLSGQPTYAGAPTPQQQILQGQNQLPGAVGDIGNLIMMYPFLRDTMGGGGGGNMTNSGLMPRMPLGTGGIPGSLFGGIRF